MKTTVSLFLCMLTMVLISSPLQAKRTSLPLPDARRDTLVTLTGLGQATLAITLRDGQSIPLTLEGQDLLPAESTVRAFHRGPHFPEVLPDASILISLGSTPHWGSAITRQLYIRPNPGHYPADQQPALLEKWADFTGASEHQPVLRISSADRSLRFWIDGRFFTSVSLPAEVESLHLTLETGARLVTASHARPLTEGVFTTLELPLYARPGEQRLTATSLPAGRHTFGDVPIDVAPTGQEINVGVARALKLADSTRTDYYNQYHMRTPFDGVPETIMFSVPSQPYSHGHFLCAVAADPDSSPVVSVRITRHFAGSPAHSKRGRGNAIAESELRLLDDRGQPLPHVTPVGTATLGHGDAARPVTLYLARVDLNTGTIADLLQKTGLEDLHQGDTHAWGMTSDYLDIELAGELMDWHPPSNNFGRRPLGLPSGVRVLGLTLQALPATVSLTTGVPGNHLYRHENPALQIHLTPREADRWQTHLAYQVTDYHGRTVLEGQERLTLAGDPFERTLDLSDLDFGWYRMAMALSDPQGETQWRQNTTFALLPPDTRRAKRDSPFGTWWNKYYHLSEGDLAIIGPIYQKMGLRHTIPSVTNHAFFGRNYSHQELARYDMGLSQISSLRLLNRQRIVPEPLNEAAARREIQNLVTRNPEVKRALIYHEHRLQIPEELTFPAELLGERPQALSETAQQRLELFRDNAVAISKIYRELAPDVKLYHGNSTRFGFHPLVYLRGGFPKEYLDVLSLEHTATAKAFPESPPHPGQHSQVLWMLRELTRHYGYQEVPISASFENFNIPSEGMRPIEGIDPLHQQAQFYVRNILHAMAFGVDVIHGGNVQDVNNAYYWTHWGPAGFNFRDLTPKPAFSAMATLTQVLDQARYQRWIDTGSDSVYCLEFERDGAWVYVMWSVREDRPMTLHLAERAQPTWIDLVGRQRTVTDPADTLALQVTPDPVYLLSPVPIEHATVEAPAPAAPTFAPGRLLSALDDPADWRVVPRADAHYESLDPGVPRRHAQLALASTQDADAGPTLQVQLVPQTGMPAVAAQYAMLEPVAPITLDQPTRGIAVQVKGNASWGRIHWELEDASGRTWKMTHDPINRTSLNFDGWRWIQVGLPEKTPGGYHGEWSNDWSCFHGTAQQPWRELTYPLELKRMVIELRSHLVYLTDLKPVRQPAIQLKNLVTVE